MTVLALRALGLGDLLTAVPALRALAAAFPDEVRLLAAPAALAPIVELIGPDPRRAPTGPERTIQALRPLPAWVGGAARPRVAAARDLPRGTVAVNLHGRGPESHRLLLATAPRRLIAFAHPEVPESADGPSWDGGPDAEHEVARWCRLLGAFEIEADPGALTLAPPARPPSTPAGATLLHPGAASAARRWPAERWALVARAERARGHDVVVTGSAAEAPLAHRIAAAAYLPPRAVAAGRTDLGELAALVAGAGRVVCGDTGVAHLATAFGTPSVVLFGPTSPAVWGPPPERPWHRVLWTGRSGDAHARSADAGLLGITAGDVIAALAVLPDRAAPDRAATA